MSWKALAQELEGMLGGVARADEPMSQHTTIGVGGSARLLVEPASIGELSAVVRAAGRHGVRFVAVGKGSNLIVRDGGYDGVIIKLGRNMSKVTVNRRTVRAEGGASFARLCRTMTRAGRAGLEFGIGIPGSVGGAVWMNAGAFGGEVSGVLRRVRVVDGTGEVQTLAASAIEFSYRRTSLPEGVIVAAATFACAPGSINEEAYRRALGRKETQPIDERTFGSTFVNPPGDYAARLIEACGLKGVRRGGAEISTKHANFIVNPDGNATAADVEALIGLMRDRVREKHGVILKTEVVIIGNQ
jgi:UDP-N-acetylmuramate dehydrogenase